MSAELVLGWFMAPGGPGASLNLVGLAAARTVPIAYLLPVFGGPHINPMFRVAFGLALALMALPVLGSGAAVADMGPVMLTVLLAREVLVGLTLGFVASLTFRAAEMAGRLADTLRGANMSEVIAPTSGERTSPVGDLFLLLAVVVFFEIGGLGHLLRALARSYEAVPLGLSSAPAAGGLVTLVIVASARALEAAVGLAAPILVAALVADVALGLIARAAPQVPVYFVGLPAKALGGVGVLLLAMGFVKASLEGLISVFAALVENVVDLW
jgi:type III secretion protein SpaR/YscT/HrcT